MNRRRFLGAVLGVASLPLFGWRSRQDWPPKIAEPFWRVERVSYDHPAWITAPGLEVFYEAIKEHYGPECFKATSRPATGYSCPAAQSSEP